MPPFHTLALFPAFWYLNYIKKYKGLIGINWKEDKQSVTWKWVIKIQETPENSRQGEAYDFSI